MKPGDIVKTPEAGGLWANLPAIVIRVEPRAVTVHTGSAELVYETDALRPFGTMKLGRSYAVGKRRFRAVVYTGANGASKEVHVVTRESDALGEETRALEIRKLAFALLRAQL